MEKDSDLNKNTSESGVYLVCKGALCKCTSGTTPAKLKITTHSKYYINDPAGEEKLVATVKDIQFEEPIFGNCGINNNKKCKPATVQWKIQAKAEHPTAGGFKILTVNGKLTCNIGGLIEILTHGQTQAVSSIDLDDYSAGIENAVNCLASSDEIIKEKKEEIKIAPISTLIYKDKESQKDYNIVVRKDKEVVFEAKPGTVKSPKIFAPELINWTICTREASEVMPKLKSNNPATYAHYGNKLPVTFKKAGFYFIEAYGREMSTYKYASGPQNSDGCVFQIEVIDSNKVVDIKTTPTMEFDKKNNIYIVPRGTTLLFKVETCFPLEEEDKNFFHIKIFNNADQSCEAVYYTETFSFTAKNETCYQIVASIGENKKTITIESINDDVINIEPQILIMRPDKRQVFKPIMKYGKDPDILNRIEWYINNLREHGGTRFTYHSRTSGKKKLEAFVPPAWLSALSKGKRYGLLEFAVKKCEILDLRPTDNNYPANNTTLYMGKSLTLKAFTNFEDYSVTEDGEIQWSLMLSPSGKSDNPRYDTKMDATDGDKKTHNLLSNQPMMAFGTKRTVTFTPYRPGKYAITATLNNSIKTIVITVEYGKILQWCFTDDLGNRRDKIGWKQDFYISIQVKGWENLNGKINLWIDKRKNEKFIHVPADELQKEVTFDNEGKINPVCIKKESGIWEQLTKLATEHDIDKNLRLCFTIKELSVKCENQKKTKTYQEEGDLYGQVFPDKSEGEIGRTIDVVYELDYSGFFIESDGVKLKRIVKYGEPVGAKIFVMPGRKDAEKSNNYDYSFTLKENLKGKDMVWLTQIPLCNTDAEGNLKQDINTNTMLPDLHKGITGSDFLPRIFYFELYRRKKGTKNYESKPVYIYPEDYNKAGYLENGEIKNDENIIDLQEDISVPDTNTQKVLNANTDLVNKIKLSNHRNYFLQLKVVKDTKLNRSLSNAAPIIIGEDLDKKKKCEKCICREYDLIWGREVNCKFRQKVVSICKDLWPNNYMEMANGLMAVMAVETGEEFKAHVIEGRKVKSKASDVMITDFEKKINILDEKGRVQYNTDGTIKTKRSSRAVGLIQFTQDPLVDFGEFKNGEGFDKLDSVKLKFAQMGEIKQLDYVKRYFEKAATKILKAEDIYIHVFAPDRIDMRNDDDVLYDKNLHPSKYGQNESIDKENDNNGKIQRKELLKRFWDKYEKGKNFMDIPVCEENPEEESKNSGGWHDPVDNPQITLYMQSGNEWAKYAAFGYTRKETRKYGQHQGLDIFAIEGTNVYACLKGKVVTAEAKGSYGKIIIIEISDTDQLKIFKERKRNYTLKYSKDGEEEKGEGFSDSGKIYFRYAHLSEISVEKGTTVASGIIIGKSGTTGVPGGTCGPHVHFEIASSLSGKMLENRINPGFYVHYKNDSSITNEEKKTQTDRKNKGKK